VLLELASRTGVTFEFEPGAVQCVPERFRTVTLFVDSTARQALESLAGLTGLAYDITDTGVRLRTADDPRTRARPVASVAIGEGTQVLVYEDELSDQARAKLRERSERAVRQIESTLDE
jgi:hypothetical protein